MECSYFSVFINLYQQVYNISGGTNNLMSFLLYDYPFWTFQQVFQMLLVLFLQSKNPLKKFFFLLLTKKSSCRIIVTIFEQKSKQLINTPNVGLMIEPKLLFSGSVVISDLYLFQETVLLSPCFRFI